MVYLLVFALVIEALAAQCNSYQQCQSRTLTGSSITCYGHRGCESADITSTAWTYLRGMYSGISATISSPSMEISGFQAANGADISATTVNAYSLQCLINADIAPIGDAGSVTVNFGAWQSGHNTDIRCQDGQTCVVNCMMPEACYNVQFYCYSGASCSFTQSCADASSTVYCLDVHNANTGGLTDVDIHKIYLENKNKKPDPVDTVPVDNPDEPDQPDMPYQPFNSIPNHYNYGNYYLSLTNGQFALFSLLCAAVILASIGLCVYNLSDTAKRVFLQKEDFN